MSLVKITVNNKEIIADTEKTLLDNILENGIYLPHLCHNKQLESYGGCGLCLVEVEGIRKPLRACSTTSIPSLFQDSRTSQHHLSLSFCKPLA